MTSDDIFTTHNKTVDENDDTEHTSRSTHSSKTTTCKKFFSTDILSLKVSEQEINSKGKSCICNKSEFNQNAI